MPAAPTRVAARTSQLRPPPGGVSQKNSRAVGKLDVAPVPERLQQVLLTAKTFEVFQHRLSAGRRILLVEGDGVVKIADNGRAAASGEAADHQGGSRSRTATGSGTPSNILLAKRSDNTAGCATRPTAYGATRILQCRSGWARSSNAWPTPSRLTSPVINGATSMSPSAIARSDSANSSGV
jgi:hypothetical protein